jgi:hypothetical protein
MPLSTFTAGRWFSPGTLISSTNKTDHHDIAEIMLKVALNTIPLTLTLSFYCIVLKKTNTPSLMHQDSNPLSTAISASMITITPPIH